MKCKNCGAPLDEDAVFCVSCGAKVEAQPASSNPVFGFSAPEKETPASPETEKKKVNFPTQKLIGLIVGTILIIIGIVRIISAGTTISSTSFGADFYTYTYRGIVAITEQLASIQASLGWVVVAIGAAVDVRALRG